MFLVFSQYKGISECFCGADGRGCCDCPLGRLMLEQKFVFKSDKLEDVRSFAKEHADLWLEVYHFGDGFTLIAFSVPRDAGISPCGWINLVEKRQREVQSLKQSIQRAQEELYNLEKMLKIPLD